MVDAVKQIVVSAPKCDVLRVGAREELEWREQIVQVLGIGLDAVFLAPGASAAQSCHA